MGLFNFKFDKLMGIFCFLLIYVFAGIQIYVLINVEDGQKIKNTSYLYFWKNVSFILLFLSTICHLQSSFTDPGLITHSNNIEFIDFYSDTRSLAVSRANLYNKSSRHLIRPPEDDEEFDSDCEYDDSYYAESPLFNEEKINEMNKEFGYELSQCKKCKVCRMPGVHHCVTCQGCIYSLDHHCPWMNNCIGQFNQKYFIQYCVYTFLSNFCFGFITVYYVVIKQPLM